METAQKPEKDLRALAAAQLERRQDFAIHVAAYLSVNTLLVAIWAIADGGAQFWPIVPIAAWGVGLALHAWSVYGHSPMTTEDQIAREAERLRAKGAAR
jgi:glucose dehydrogenase